MTIINVPKVVLNHFRGHINAKAFENLKNKMTSKVALVKRLACLDWGKCFDVLRIATLLLVVALAEYCFPIWNQSSHANKLNTPFDEALCTISGCIKPTRISFFTFLAGIEFFENRCHYVCEKLFCRADNQDHPLHQMLYCSLKLTRLRSRNLLRNLYLTISVAENSVPEDITEFIP